jgi:hypothetical protein
VLSPEKLRPENGRPGVSHAKRLGSPRARLENPDHLRDQQQEDPANLLDVDKNRHYRELGINALPLAGKNIRTPSRSPAYWRSCILCDTIWSRASLLNPGRVKKSAVGFVARLLTFLAGCWARRNQPWSIDVQCAFDRERSEPRGGAPTDGSVHQHLGPRKHAEQCYYSLHWPRWKRVR